MKHIYNQCLNLFESYISIELIPLITNISKKYFSKLVIFFQNLISVQFYMWVTLYIEY